MLSNSTSPVVGRYAPSPTGDLHLGNLRTALLAWLSARSQGGRFIVRMEDIDQPRVVAGSADQILRDLEWLGLDWDGGVVFQSHRHDLYQDALDQLSVSGLIYPCFCSRKDIQAAALERGVNSSIYSGLCSRLSEQDTVTMVEKKAHSLRVRVGADLQASMGDFVLKRADQLFAYQLAVTVDDLDQGVSEILRGADLLDSTPKQQYLAQLLGHSGKVIKYLHAPLMYNVSGEKMSKRDGSFSAREWRDEGKSAESLVGFLSYSIGLVDHEAEITPRELLSRMRRSVVSAIS